MPTEVGGTCADTLKQPMHARAKATEGIMARARRQNDDMCDLRIDVTRVPNRDASRDAGRSAYEYVCTRSGQPARQPQELAVRYAFARHAYDVRAHAARDLGELVERQQVRERIPRGGVDAEIAVHAQPAQIEKALRIELLDQTTCAVQRNLAIERAGQLHLPAVEPQPGRVVLAHAP